jgi:hypothetical protein
MEMPEGEIMKPRNSVVSTENFALFGFGVQVVLPKAGKDFANVVLVFVGIPGENKNVIKIYYYKFVENVREDSVHKTLKGRGSIGEAEVHDHEIEGAVSGSEGGFPFVAFRNVDKIVSASGDRSWRKCESSEGGRGGSG